MTQPLLMIPGPTPVEPAVLAALAEPVRSHTGPENAATMLHVQDMLRALVGSETARVHVFAGAGTLAMEAALINHARPRERVVVVSHGYFGDRFADIAATFGMRAEVLRPPWGEHASITELKALIQGGDPPAAVCMTHVDTSTGVRARCDEIARAARAAAPATIVVVDGVCATGGISESMDAWDADVVLTGAQKALGVPPGLALLAVSPRAVRRRAEIGDIPAYYADLNRWDASLADPRVYFSTHAVSLLRALQVSLERILAEGLPARFERHERTAALLRDGMAELGFSPLTHAEVLAPTLSVLGLPDGTDEASLRAAMQEQGVIVAPCIGAWAGAGLRIGHMGSAGEREVARTVEAAAAALGA
jgi:aspartate aminotransferase-like enzyme